MSFYGMQIPKVLFVDCEVTYIREESRDGATCSLLTEGGLLEKDFTKRKWNE